MADAEPMLRVTNPEVEVLRDNLATRKVILRLELCLLYTSDAADE